jgi:dipeptidyl aminopeptidase/acylaminoacyl peptidase
VQRVMVRHPNVGGTLRTQVLVIFLGLLCLFAVSAHADPRRVQAGESIHLAPGEGVLALVVDSPLALQRVRVLGQVVAHDISIDSLEPGRTLALYVVAAGSYRWDRVDTDISFGTDDDPEYAFEVRAGAVNYPGDMVFRPRNSTRALMHVANRGLGVLDRLEREYPALATLPFEYIGHYPDPFPAFYQQQRAGAAAPQRSVLAPRDAGDLPLAVESLWREPRMERVSLSPAGDVLALVQRMSNRHWQIELADLSNPARPRQTIFSTDAPVRDLGWSGDRRLIVSGGGRSGEHVLTAIDLRGGASGPWNIDRRELPRAGRVVDLLPQNADHVLIATRLDAGQAVHRVNISSQAALAAATFRWEDRLNRGIDGNYTWLTDGQGRLRAATAADQRGDNVLYHGANDRFDEVMRISDEHGFQPLRVSADGSLIYGLTEQQREQRELVSFNPATGELLTVFARPAVDMMAPVFDFQHQLIGVRYYERGQFATHYFDPADRAIDASLRRALPDRSISLLDRDRSGRHLVLSVEGSDMPAAIYHFDRASGTLTLVEQTRPWLQQHQLAPAHVINAVSADGLAVEGYLTLPAADGPRPLIVMPHGGPIGIRNQRHYDPEVQFLASLGYAVLQVNFRGSTGFGRSFREAGHNQLGRGIEDDVEAALAVALREHPLDASRMCLVGASYGGYSALMSALRAPGRFKCVAAISGFTDRVLQFTASDSGRSAEIRQLLEVFIGNPNRELDAMTTGSPLYRIGELDVPVLLAHGTEDLRVDYEQTRRLVRMMNIAGRSPTLVTLFGEGHSIEAMHNREKLWHAVAGFLRENI